MTTALWTWLDESLQHLRQQTTIAATELPDPDKPDHRLHVGLIDPTTVSLIIGYAQRQHREAEAAYLGFVVQEPFGTWRGLTGFYLLWCPKCDPGGNRALHQLKRELANRAINLTWIGDHHPALLPRTGWFDGGRLVFGGNVNAQETLAPFWTTESLIPPADDASAALIATAPVVTDLANLVLVDNLVPDTATLRHLTGSTGVWTMRTGTVDALRQLADLTATPTSPRVTTARHPGAVPAAWGAYTLANDTHIQGPVPNLWKTLRNAFPPPHYGTRSAIRIAHLPASRAARLTDIRQLTPALFVSAYPRVN